MRYRHVAMLATVLGAHQGAALAADTPPDGLTVTPTVQLLYDSNVLRASSDRVSGARDDLRVTPAVDITLRKLLGGTLVTATGTAGYDFYRRFTFLNRERIQGNLAADIPFAGICHANPQATINFAQANLSDQGIIEGNTERTQDYRLGLICERTVGLFPRISGEYLKTTNSAENRSVFNIDTKSVSVGIGYRRPSLGDLLITGGYQHFSRPEAGSLIGLLTGADIWSAGAEFDRAVAPRLSYSASVNYFHVSPSNAAVPAYSGLGWRASASWRPSPRASLDLAFERSAQNESNVGATYVVQTSYRIAGRVNISARSRLDVRASLIDRRFHGELDLDTGITRGSDSTKSIAAGYHYAPFARLQSGLEFRREWRTGGASFFHYTSNSVLLTLGLKL